MNSVRERNTQYIREGSPSGGRGSGREEGLDPWGRPTAAHRWRVKRESNWSVRHTLDSDQAINQSISQSVSQSLKQAVLKTD